MSSRARVAGAAAICIGVCASIPAAHSMTLAALCAQDHVAREVARFSKKLRYPAGAKGMKPNTANFDKEAGSMSCAFSLTAGNVYDFENYSLLGVESGS